MLDFKKAFQRSERYKTKIFYDKKGPIFDYKKIEFTIKNSNLMEEPKKDMMSKTSYISTQEQEIRKRKIKEMSSLNKIGYSFGLKEGLSKDFWKKRQEHNQEMKKEFENLFQLDNITSSKDLMFSKNKLKSSSSDSIRDKIKRNKENKKMLIKRKLEKRFENVKKRYLII